MESRAIKKYVGISPRKIARLGRECVNKELKYVKPRLSMLPQHAARELYKTLCSAEANFQVKNPNFNTDELVVKTVQVNKGPTMRRMKPRARGSADVIKKRSCHIHVTVGEMQSDTEKEPVAEPQMAQNNI